MTAVQAFPIGRWAGLWVTRQFLRISLGHGFQVGLLKDRRSPGQSLNRGKKTWCCEHKSKGCVGASAPYDCSKGWLRAGLGHCEPGLDLYKETWTMGKRTWCCAHKHLGCELGNRQWISKPPLYDCSVGLSWSSKWTDGKKTWCCAHKHVACEAAARFILRSDGVLNQ